MAKDFASKAFQEFHSPVLLFHVSHVTFLDWLLRTKDPHFQEMRTNYTVPFLQNFNMGCAPRKLPQLISWNGGNHRKPTCFSLYEVPFGLGEFDLCCSLAAEVFGQWESHSSQALAFLYRNRYQNYSQGEWQVARTLLSKTHGMLGEKDRGRPQLGKVRRGKRSKTTVSQSLQDGPSGALLRFMETPYQFKAFRRHVVGEKQLSPGWTVKVLIWFWVVGPANGVWRLFSGTRILDLDFMQAQAPEWWRGRNSAELTDVTLQNLVLQCDYFANIKWKHESNPEIQVGGKSGKLRKWQRVDLMFSEASML